MKLPVRQFICLLLLLLAARSSFVHAQAIEARVASLNGGNAARTNNGNVFKLKAGDALKPGDVIDTRGGAQVLIEMTDGSVVIVRPSSQVVLKDFRTAGTLRDLFEIISGRVRVKINHWGGKPNPVRVNTPSASIAVRGTEFSITVEGSETRVAVHEGLVEVSNLSATQQRALVEPGQGVIVRPNEALRFFIPGPGSEIGERRTNDKQNQTAQNGKASYNAGGDVLRNLAGQYERYIDSYVEPGETAPLVRFLALPDAHLDSLENPAYATDFNLLARALLLPSLRNKTAAPRDSGLFYQTSVFAPLGESRFVLGGSFAATRSGVHTFAQQSLDLTPPLAPVNLFGLRTSATDNQSSSYNSALVLARRFGEAGRTSLGLGVEYSHAHSTLKGSTELVSDATFGLSVLSAREALRASSNISRTRLRLGVSHEFANGNKLGVFFHQGVGTATDRDQTRTFNGLPLSLDSVRYASHSSELGMRLRGRLTRKWFYGLEATALRVGLNEEIRRAAIVPAHEFETITRLAAGGGLSYLINPRAFFSLDASLGQSRVRESFHEDATGNLLEDVRENMNFVSLHMAAQSDVWRQSFVSASVLALRQLNTTDRQLFPDLFGRRLTSYGFSVPEGRTRERFTEPLADFSAGWRFRQDFTLQYIYSTDFGRTAASHVLLLRFNFGKRE